MADPLKQSQPVKPAATGAAATKASLKDVQREIRALMTQMTEMARLGQKLDKDQLTRLKALQETQRELKAQAAEGKKLGAMAKGLKKGYKLTEKLAGISAVAASGDVVTAAYMAIQNKKVRNFLGKLGIPGGAGLLAASTIAAQMVKGAIDQEKAIADAQREATEAWLDAHKTEIGGQTEFYREKQVLAGKKDHLQKTFAWQMREKMPFFSWLLGGGTNEEAMSQLEREAATAEGKRRGMIKAARDRLDLFGITEEMIQQQAGKAFDDMSPAARLDAVDELLSRISTRDLSLVLTRAAEDERIKHKKELEKTNAEKAAEMAKARREKELERIDNQLLSARDKHYAASAYYGQILHIGDA